MKSFCIAAFILVAACSATDTYDPKHDDLDIEGVVGDVTKLQEFVDCFNDKIACSPLPAWFKKDLPEALELTCSKCTPAQRHIVKVFFDGLKKTLPDDYDVLSKKYDADNKLLPALEAAVAND